MTLAQNPRTTTPEGFDWNAPVDLTKAPDVQRVLEAFGDASAYAENDLKDWYSPGDEMALWDRAAEVFEEEFGYPLLPPDGPGPLGLVLLNHLDED